MTISPTLNELVKVPGYVKYLRTQFKLPAHLLAPHADSTERTPWRVWVKQPHPDDPAKLRWRKKDFPGYVGAFNLMVKALTTPGVLDVSVTCRPRGFAPTIALSHSLKKAGLLGIAPDSSALDEKLEWCRYCRRPVVFAFFTSHHAIRPPILHELSTLPQINEFPRCPYCGIRRSV